MNKELFREIDEACSRETTLVGLRKAFSAFKPRIDPLNEVAREKTRIIYWTNKRRIEHG